EEFERDYPDATTVILEQNYRSTQRILSAANAVISRNSGRREKRLWTDAGDGEPITGFAGEDEHEEARFIGEEIDRLTDAGSVRRSDIAVFYRTNAQSRAIEDVFIRIGLPYRVVGGVRFYERREIRDALAYLRAIANPEDEVSIRRILNVPKRGIGDRAEGAIEAYAQRERIPFASALERVRDINDLASRSAASIESFVTMMQDLRTVEQAGAAPAVLLQAAMEASGYLAELQASADPQDESRVENLAELEAVAAEFTIARPEGTLVDFLEQVSLVADADDIPDADDSGGVVTLMTEALGEDKAQSIISRINPSSAERPIEILDWMDARSIAELITDEHPQIIALVIACLDYGLAADVLSMLPDEVQPDIVRRIASLNTIQPEALRDLEHVMQRKFKASATTRSSQIGGVKAAARIMNFTKTAMEQRILREVRKDDKDLMQSIQDNMFVFDNLIKSDDRSLQTLLRNVEPEQLVLALKGADEALRDKLLGCMSTRAAANIRDEMEALGPVRLTDVQEAQKIIVATARRL
ncbi:MAG: flagellar motor switch protein FliG, partial [Rhodobacteraceae bacterium]|nr:flagellar motor switch protein FliG [Paracoccaceae bacterium]